MSGAHCEPSQAERSRHISQEDIYHKLGVIEGQLTVVAQMEIRIDRLEVRANSTGRRIAGIVGAATALSIVVPIAMKSLGVI